MGERREELRRDHVARVCDVLRSYVLGGSPFRMETVADEDTGDRRLVFLIDDWETFRNLLESGDRTDGDGKQPPPV